MTAVIGSSPLSGQTPRYAASQLHCARFRETARSEVETEMARGGVDAVLERDGIWSFRARDTSGGVALEGWYDSLALRRRSAGQEVAVDTDGLIGGRYRGLLAADGRYTEHAVPFVPDEVAELARSVQAALARAGYRGDPLPLVRRERPEWTRERWDAAVSELDRARSVVRPAAVMSSLGQTIRGLGLAGS